MIFPRFQRMICCTATSKSIPGKPSSATVVAVMALIGINKPVAVANEFSKNNNSVAIINRTPICPAIRNGFTGAPIIKSKTTIPPNIDNISQDSILSPQRELVLLYCMIATTKKDPKSGSFLFASMADSRFP